MEKQYCSYEEIYPICNRTIYRVNCKNSRKFSILVVLLHISGFNIHYNASSSVSICNHIHSAFYEDTSYVVCSCCTLARIGCFQSVIMHVFTLQFFLINIIQYSIYQAPSVKELFKGAENLKCKQTYPELIVLD